MTRPTDPTALDSVVELVAEHGTDAIAAAFGRLLGIAMEAQRDAAIGASHHERSEDRRGHRNGYKPKTLATRVGEIEIQVPKTRGIPFYPDCLERGRRSERAFINALAEMYVQGVSTRKVAAVVDELCGTRVPSSTVSRAAALLDAELEAWRTRPIGQVTYLILDARYEKVREGGRVISCAILTAIGVLPDGSRSILGVSCSLSEAEVHWRDFLRSLADWGMHGLRHIVSDDHAGLKAAREACFPSVPWQRCQVHLTRNAMAHVSRQSARAEVASDLRVIFNAADEEEARRRLKLAVDRWRPEMPRLAAWMESNLPDGFAVFALPPGHRRRLRTTNLIESINTGVKRRTRVAPLFPNPAPALRLVSAILIEKDEEWASGRKYRVMEADAPTHG